MGWSVFNSCIEYYIYIMCINIMFVCLCINNVIHQYLHFSAL